MDDVQQPLAVAVTKRLLNAEVSTHVRNDACELRHGRRRRGRKAFDERREPALRGS